MRGLVKTNSRDRLVSIDKVDFTKDLVPIGLHRVGLIEANTEMLINRDSTAMLMRTLNSRNTIAFIGDLSSKTAKEDRRVRRPQGSRGGIQERSEAIPLHACGVRVCVADDLDDSGHCVVAESSLHSLAHH